MKDDLTYEAARKKDPARRQASAAEFALSRAQLVGAVMFVATVQPAYAIPTQSQVSERPLDFSELLLLLFTVLLAAVLAKLLLFPWIRETPTRRVTLRDQHCQTDDAQLVEPDARTSRWIQTLPSMLPHVTVDQGTQAQVVDVSLLQLEQWTLPDPPPAQRHVAT